MMTITLTQLQKELLQDIIGTELIKLEDSNPWPVSGKPQVMSSLRSLLTKLESLK